MEATSAVGGRPDVSAVVDLAYESACVHENGAQVTPRNEIERLFNVVVIMSAMVIFSTFISAITNAMNQLRNLNSNLAQ